MCGRYVIDYEEDLEMVQILNEVQKNHPEKQISVGEIFPTNSVPVLIGENKQLKPDLITWGFPNFKNSGVLINARSETVEEKKMFRDSLFVRRCVIPSTGFFEWKKENKSKFLFQLPNENTLYMAGLFHEFNQEKRFVILTTSANDSMLEIHNRMPLVLNKNNLYSWVFDTKRAIEILHEVPPLLLKNCLKG